MDAENRCPACDAELAANAPRGLCPDCLLKQGLQTTPLPSGGQASADFVPPTPADLAPHFPDLEILALVGRGGMGMVYKARQKRLDRFVALKILSPKIGQDPAFAERFAREARAMAMLNHPHIVAVYDFGQTTSSLPSSVLGRGAGGEGDSILPSPATMGTWCPGRGAGGEGGPGEGSLYYFLMEFVDGLTLRQLLDAGKLAPEEALAIVPQICEALQYAHDKGLVHRDIKPENVLLDKEGRVKIADFGIAKLMGREAQDTALTGAGQIVGTPQYMAPEQIEHPLQVDHRADIYSLGVVFYQMLTGELPIGRFAPPSKKVQIDVRLDEVVLRALEKEPEQRYQQASEIKTEVESIVTTPRTAADRKICPADPKSPSTGGPWVWADTIAFLGGMVWTSTAARVVANASALGFLGFLGCLGFLPFPGMHRCFGFSGFFFFFGLIGVAVMIEYAARHRAKKHAEGRSIRDMQCGEENALAAASGALRAPYAAPPRLSKTALVGAVWGGPFFVIIILSLCIITLWLTLSINSLLPLLSPILILLLATPLGVPILGYVALKQIRHSAGRLYGLGLALFDLLAFPLLALDAVIAGLGLFAARASASYWSSAAGTYGDLVGVVAVLLIVVACVVIDFLTIRWVWRAVNRPPAGALPADQPKRAGLKTMLSVAAPVPAFVLGVFGFAFLLWSLAERFESAYARIQMRIFEADAKLVDQLVPGPTRMPGQMQDSAVRIPSRDPQTAEVSADVFARLLADGAKEPGLLDEQTREGAWWPKLATSSHYMRHGKVHGEGWVDGFLGIRRHKDVRQLRVELNVMQGMNSAYECWKIAWEGRSPPPKIAWDSNSPPEAARAFFLPFSRQDGTARYLVIAFEVGSPRLGEFNSGESQALTEQRDSSISAAPWGDWNAGWRVRLRAAKATWASEELPEFTVDLRKQKTAEPDAVQQSLHNWLLDVDGRRFRLRIFTTSREHKQVFEPGTTRQDFIAFRFHKDEKDEAGLHVRTGEGGNWINSYELDPIGKDGQVLSHPKPEDRFQWTAGKHVVKIAFPMMPNPPAGYTEADLARFVFSNAVEVQIQGNVSLHPGQKTDVRVVQPTRGGKYTASAFLRVAMREPVLSPTERDRFDIYKSTQRELLRSRFIMLAALGNPELAKLPSVQRATVAGNPANWLMSQLRVQFPGNAEIMQVSASSADPEEAVTLVNVVVNTYLKEVVNADHDQRQLRLKELERAHAEKETEIRTKREELKKLAEHSTTSDSVARSRKPDPAAEKMQADIKNLDVMLTALAKEKEMLKADLRVIQPVTLLKEATIPEQPAAPQGPVLIYEVDPTSTVSASDMDKLLKAIDRRLNSGAEKLARVRKVGDGRIEVALLRSNDADRQRVERLLARPGTLEFRILANKRDDKAVIEQAQKDQFKTEVLDPSGKRLAWWVPVKAGEEQSLAGDPDIALRTKKHDHRDITQILVVADPCNVTGAYLTKAEATADNRGSPCLNFTFNDAGGKRFAKLTGDHLPSGNFRHRLGIILDGELYSAPRIMSTISKQGAVTGNFTKEQVSELADSLNSGSLPVRIRLVRRSDPAAAVEHFKQIAVAIHDYYDANHHFPPAALYGPDGKTRYSWRVALLPFLGQKLLYDFYHFDEAWDSPNNRKVLEKMPDVFRRLEEPVESNNACCFALVGPDTVFDGKEGTKMESITDGTSCTILLVEAKRNIPWTKPEDIPCDPHKPLPALGGYFEGGFHVVMADMTVRFIPSTVSEKVLRALITKAGGEPVEVPDVPATPRLYDLSWKRAFKPIPPEAVKCLASLKAAQRLLQQAAARGDGVRNPEQWRSLTDETRRGSAELMELLRDTKAWPLVKKQEELFRLIKDASKPGDLPLSTQDAGKDRNETIDRLQKQINDCSRQIEEMVVRHDGQ